MSVKAKFYVVSSTPHYFNQPGVRPNKDQPPHQVNVVLSPVTSGTGKDNETWSKWTPSGKLEMSITNPAAFEQFEVGQYVYLTLDFVPFEEPAAR